MENELWRIESPVNDVVRRNELIEEIRKTCSLLLSRTDISCTHYRWQDLRTFAVERQHKVTFSDTTSPQRAEVRKNTHTDTYCDYQKAIFVKGYRATGDMEIISLYGLWKEPSQHYWDTLLLDKDWASIRTKTALVQATQEALETILTKLCSSLSREGKVA